MELNKGFFHLAKDKAGQHLKMIFCQNITGQCGTKHKNIPNVENPESKKKYKKRYTVNDKPQTDIYLPTHNYIII